MSRNDLSFCELVNLELTKINRALRGNQALLLGKKQMGELRHLQWNSFPVKPKPGELPSDVKISMQMTPEEKVEHLFQLRLVEVEADDCLEVVFSSPAHRELEKENIALREELDSIKFAIRHNITTAIVDGNDLTDWGWMLQRDHNWEVAAVKHLRRLEETGIVKKISGMGGGSCDNTNRMGAMMEAYSFVQRIKGK